MTAPLGFRRSTRKKLRRCGHARIDSVRDLQSLDRIVTCSDCGARASFDVTRLATSQLSDHDFALAYRSWLPRRIAR